MFGLLLLFYYWLQVSASKNLKMLVHVVQIRKVYLGSFLGPRDLKILSLGVIWNFGKGTGQSWVDIRLWGTMGPFI